MSNSIPLRFHQIRPPPVALWGMRAYGKMLLGEVPASTVATSVDGDCCFPRRLPRAAAPMGKTVMSTKRSSRSRLKGTCHSTSLDSPVFPASTLGLQDWSEIAPGPAIRRGFEILLDNANTQCRMVPVEELDTPFVHVHGALKCLASRLTATVGSGACEEARKWCKVADRLEPVVSQYLEAVYSGPMVFPMHLRPDSETIHRFSVRGHLQKTFGDILNLRDRLRARLSSAGPARTEDGSPWVPANHLWRDRFDSYKKLAKFRKQQPQMFRNRTSNKLEIHAPLWLAHWNHQHRANFESLDTAPPSVADDPHVQDELLAGALQRMDCLRKKKQTGKH